MTILERLREEYDYDIVDDFVTHYSIMSYTMENLILQLTKADTYKDKINELFRIAHNIKSSTAYLKLTPINKLAILLEDILSDARELQGPASDSFVDWLLIVKDQFWVYKKNIEEGFDGFDGLDSRIIKIPINLEREN
jgi:two-component system chemotaxis sensor kinase CheA